MSNLLFKIQNFIQKRKTSLYLILFFVIFIVTIYLDKIVGLIIKIFPGSSYPGMVSISDRILFITFIILILYTWETFGMKREMVKQTELEQMPIILLFIRDYRETYGKELAKREDKMARINTHYYFKEKFQKYLIKGTPYCLKLRNSGRGTAFNVEVKGKKFNIVEYESQFFPPGSEHLIGISNKDGSDVSDVTELNGEIFIVYCKSIIHKEYSFRYKIIDIKKKEVEFLRD